jgi:hypothetical protein
LQLTLGHVVECVRGHVRLLNDLPNDATLAQKIVASSVLPITEILTIENDKLHNTFLHIAFGSQSLLKTTSDQTGSNTNWRTVEGDQRGWMGANKNSYERTSLCLKFKPQSQNPIRKWWTHQPTAQKWSPQSYERSGKRMRSIRHPISKIWPKQWTNIAAKTPQWTCSALDRICPASADISGNWAGYVRPTQKFLSKLWFLSYGAPKWMKLGHNGHLNTSNIFPMSFFPNSKISLLILDELEEPRFWEKHEKFTKSKGLEPWIHFKIRGRWWDST